MIAVATFVAPRSIASTGSEPRARNGSTTSSDRPLGEARGLLVARLAPTQCAMVLVDDVDERRVGPRERHRALRIAGRRVDLLGEQQGRGRVGGDPFQELP